MLSLNPKNWGKPRPWYFRFKFDRGHARWLIELQENGYEWQPLTAINNNKLETLDFETLQEAVCRARFLGLEKVYVLYGIEALPLFDSPLPDSKFVTLPGDQSAFDSQSLSASSLRAVS